MVMTVSTFFRLLSRLRLKQFLVVFTAYAIICPLLVEISLSSQTKSNSKRSLVSLMISEKPRTLLS